MSSEYVLRTGFNFSTTSDPQSGLVREHGHLVASDRGLKESNWFYISLSSNLKNPRIETMPAFSVSVDYSILVER